MIHRLSQAVRRFVNAPVHGAISQAVFRQHQQRRGQNHQPSQGHHRMRNCGRGDTLFACRIACATKMTGVRSNAQFTVAFQTGNKA